jgi:hypothetical protein
MGETLALLTAAAPRAQRDLDRQWVASLEEHARFRALVCGTPLEPLAASLAPRLFQLTEAAIQVCLTLTASRERTLSFSARPLSLGYRRRYAASSFAECRLECAVRRHPPGPAG